MYTNIEGYWPDLICFLEYSSLKSYWKPQLLSDSHYHQYSLKEVIDNSCMVLHLQCLLSKWNKFAKTSLDVLHGILAGQDRFTWDIRLPGGIIWVMLQWHSLSLYFLCLMSNLQTTTVTMHHHIPYSPCQSIDIPQDLYFRAEYTGHIPSQQAIWQSPTKNIPPQTTKHTIQICGPLHLHSLSFLSHKPFTVWESTAHSLTVQRRQNVNCVPSL